MPTASRVVFLLLVCGWSPHPQAKENPPIIKTEQGSLRGKRVGRANVFLGIPYAKPPLGELRWRPPVDCKP